MDVDIVQELELRSTEQKNEHKKQFEKKDYEISALEKKLKAAQSARFLPKKDNSEHSKTADEGVNHNKITS